MSSAAISSSLFYCLFISSLHLQTNDIGLFLPSSQPPPPPPSKGQTGLILKCHTLSMDVYINPNIVKVYKCRRWGCGVMVAVIA